jgi:hypothetical protein
MSECYRTSSEQPTSKFGRYQDSRNFDYSWSDTDTETELFCIGIPKPIPIPKVRSKPLPKPIIVLKPIIADHYSGPT